MRFALLCVFLIVNGVFAKPSNRETAPSDADILQAIHDDVQRLKELPTVDPTDDKCSTCYEGLDCFNRCEGLLNYTHVLPYSPKRISTVFTLYSRQTKSIGVSFTYDNVTAVARFLDAPRKLVFVVHGFQSGTSAPWVIGIRESILEIEDAIVITVNWSEGCSLTTGYPQSVANTELVGRQVAVAFKNLIVSSPRNVSPKATHFIGHSLGAQMSKFFSEYFRKLSGNVLIGRITALDAASPLFETHNVCLDSSDAEFIDALHTSAGDNLLQGKLGVTRPVGHIDFYVNGGSEQPGCSFYDLFCSHRRAHEYYLEALRSTETCTFRSYACVGGLEEYKAGECQKLANVYNAITYDGSAAMPGRGVEFVDTRGSSPFCKPQNSA